ncbi:protein kinase, partial [Oryctes borbonicus]
PRSPQNLPQLKENNKRQTNIQIKFSDFSTEKLLIVKTPEKFQIFENGLVEADLNVLGRGSFGTVVSGIYKNEDVAVKVVKLRLNEELNEVKALSLNHKNVVRTIDVLINSNMNYAIVIMERLRDSKHLQNLLDDENLFLERRLVLKYALDIATGLSFCHRNNLIHMDLKPSNILLCQDDVCK